MDESSKKSASRESYDFGFTITYLSPLYQILFVLTTEITSCHLLRREGLRFELTNAKYSGYLFSIFDDFDDFDTDFVVRYVDKYIYNTYVAIYTLIQTIYMK